MTDAIINRIKELRVGRGLTQEDLARAVGVSRQSIISIERGRYTPSLVLALRMAAFFECSMDLLFQLQEERDGR